MHFSRSGVYQRLPVCSASQSQDGKVLFYLSIPTGLEINAMSQNWTSYSLVYLLTPMLNLSWVLNKVKRDKVTIIPILPK